MGQTETEIIIFVILAAIIFTVFLAGILVFVFQFRKRVFFFKKEKELLHEAHTREILNTQIEIQQQTMLHIGSEIHDNVGQKLTLASLYSKQLSTGTANLQEKIDSIGSIIDESLADLRRLSKTLTNPELANAGLLFLLNEEAKKINASGFCRINITGDKGPLLLPQQHKNILFRLLQEFIQNSLKHSGCREIIIDVCKKNNHLLIFASDNGKGFNSSRDNEGIGLHNMKRRAGELNAAYELKSEPGKGTILTLQLPIHEI